MSCHPSRLLWATLPASCIKTLNDRLWSCWDAYNTGSRHLWHSEVWPSTKKHSRDRDMRRHGMMTGVHGTTPQMPPFEQDAGPPFLLGEIGPLVSLIQRTD
jgi:hypothetical protein